MTKTCKTCHKEFLATTEFFHPAQTGRYGLKAHCKSCYRKHNSQQVKLHQKERTAYQNKWYHKNQEHIYNKNILRVYGLTREQYNTMALAQNGVCAICGETDKGGKKLNIDHDHNTGQVRGLLCYKCNSGLGSFEDNPRLLNKAVCYLKNKSQFDQLFSE